MKILFFVLAIFSSMHAHAADRAGLALMAGVLGGVGAKAMISSSCKKARHAHCCATGAQRDQLNREARLQLLQALVMGGAIAGSVVGIAKASDNCGAAALAAPMLAAGPLLVFIAQQQDCSNEDAKLLLTTLGMASVIGGLVVATTAKCDNDKDTTVARATPTPYPSPTLPPPLPISPALRDQLVDLSTATVQWK